MSSASPNVKFQFDDLTLDPGQHRLQRGGVAIPLSKLSYGLLQVLVDEAPNLVTHDVLAQKVWGPRRIVTPENLAKRVMLLRKALGDAVGQPRYIEGVRGHGYRLVPAVRRVPSPSAQPQDGRSSSDSSQRRGGAGAGPWEGARTLWQARATSGARPRRAAAAGVVALAFAALALAAVQLVPRRDTAATGDGLDVRAPLQTAAEPERRSIAVLPFATTSAAGENAGFFADGIHAELLTRLSSVGALKVITRGSVMGYREQQRNFAEIGRELGVATLLGGVVQRSAENVRMNVRLVDAQTGNQLWAETYDRRMTASDVFAIQSEIAISIADALDARLGGAKLARVQTPPTQNTRAYDFYLSGMSYARSLDFEVHRPLAIQQLESAVREDPEFAAAWAELSMARNRVHGARATTLAAAQKALELDPDLPDAHLAMAWYRYAVADVEAALHELEEAERSYGNGVLEPLMLRAQIYEQREQWTEALATLGRALDLDPRNVELWLNQSRIHMTLRDYAKAQRSVERALEIAPDADAALMRKAEIALVRDGDVSFMKELADSPLLDPLWRLQFGWQSAIQERDYERAFEFLDAFDRNRFDVRPGESYYGLTYALSGSPELAKREFEIARRRVEEKLASRPDDPRLLLVLAETLAGVGESARAVEVAQRAIALMPPSLASRQAVSVAINWVYVPAGDFDTALTALDAYLASAAPFSIEGLLVGPRLDPLRDDPRLLALREKYGRVRVE